MLLISPFLGDAASFPDHPPTCSMKSLCDPDPMAEASGDARMIPASAACWINALPDDALLRAISYLGARQLVQTSVLSRRWRNLWRSVPRINASRDEFDGMAGTWVEQDVLFKKFFNRFLMLRNPTPLDEFNLWYRVQDEDSWDWDYDAESEDANLWIGHALQCNARSVNVSVLKAEGARLHLDSRVFASKCFLTSLELTYVILFTGFFESLQMGCTMLERLKLYDCHITDTEVSSQTLKLVLIDTDCGFEKQTSISIPSLIDLRCFPKEEIPLLTNMGSLATAKVSIGHSHYDTRLGDFCQFLRGLSDVTHLDLCYQGPKLKMEKNFHWCPKFNNLTILTLGDWCLCADFYALIVFLQNSPNLMKLILKIRKVHASLHIWQNPDTQEKFIGELEERYFTCEHLKVVQIFCSKDWEDDPMCSDLEMLLVGNGISSDQIEIKNWYVRNYTAATTEASD